MRPQTGPRLLLLPLVSALVAATALAVVGSVAVRQNRDTVEHEVQARVRSNADAASRAVARQAQDYLRTVDAAAQDVSIVAALNSPGAGTMPAARSTLKTLAVGKNAPSAGLTDTRGRYVMGSPLRRRFVGRSFAYRDWYRGVTSSDRPYVSSGYRSVAGNRLFIVAVAAPVTDGGRRIGYLTLTWQLDSIRSVAEGSLRDDGITVTVTDQRGQPLTGTVDVDGRGQPRPLRVPPLTARALGGKQADVITGGAFVSAGPVPELGWTVTASLPVTTGMTPAREFRNGILLALAIAFATLLGALGYAVTTMRRRARERAVVADQAKHLAALFAASPVGIVEALSDGTITAVNEALAQMLGYSVDELVGMNAGELSPPSGEAEAAGALDGVLDGSVASGTAERVYRARSGEPVPVLVSVTALRDAAGTLQRMVAFVVDLSGPRAIETALQISDNRFRKIFDEGLIGKALTASTGVILRANRALATYLGVEVHELRGRLLTSCFAADEDQRTIAGIVASGSGELRAEVPLQGAGGTELWAKVAVHWVQEQSDEWVLLAQFQDITERRLAEERLLGLALHDDLTGLPNRRLLMERCDQVFAVARSARSGTCVTALFIDLDGFKAVNDHGGHQAGDRLLSSVAADLLAALRPADTLARVGGDEFVVLLGNDTGPETGRLLAERLAGLIRRPAPTGEGTSLTVSASIGVARVDLSREPEVDPEQLLRRADEAMYHAKQAGRDRLEIFDSELSASP